MLPPFSSHKMQCCRCHKYIKLRKKKRLSILSGIGILHSHLSFFIPFSIEQEIYCRYIHRYYIHIKLNMEKKSCVAINCSRNCPNNSKVIHIYPSCIVMTTSDNCNYISCLNCREWANTKNKKSYTFKAFSSLSSWL